MSQISLNRDSYTELSDNLKLEPLAIVGFATKLPQDAATTEKFWEFLLKARSAMTPFPKERSNAEAFYHPDPEHGGTVCISPSVLVGLLPSGKSRLTLLSIRIP
jgi:Beta-ketoacyl synthase, N-terminal domain